MHITDKTVYAWTEMTPGAKPTFGGQISVGQVILFPTSRFELIATQNEDLPPHLGDLFGLLLQATSVADGFGRPVLSPLWVEEGMHRVYSMLRLLDKRAERDRACAKSNLTTAVECALARSLALAYQSLATEKEDEMLPCSTLLREVVLNLGALFGDRSGIVIRTIIERLSLPAYKRRALVLAASELMINALTHAFRDVHDGRIEISLRLLDHRRACLRVADNGVGFGGGHTNTAVSICRSLADLVEADLTYYRRTNWATTAEIMFPIDHTAPAPSDRRFERAT